MTICRGMDNLTISG